MMDMYNKVKSIGSQHTTKQPAIVAHFFNNFRAGAGMGAVIDAGTTDPTDTTPSFNRASLF